MKILAFAIAIAAVAAGSAPAEARLSANGTSLNSITIGAALNGQIIAQPGLARLSDRCDGAGPAVSAPVAAGRRERKNCFLTNKNRRAITFKRGNYDEQAARGPIRPQTWRPGCEVIEYHAKRPVKKVTFGVGGGFHCRTSVIGRLGGSSQS